MPEQSAYTAERARLLSAFGEKLRAERKRRNLAQEGLAEVANLHRNEIGVLERGQCAPNLLTLLILADALEVPLKDLTEGVPVPRERRPVRHSKKGRPRDAPGGGGVMVEQDGLGGVGVWDEILGDMWGHPGATEHPKAAANGTTSQPAETAL
jgi:transcriptional regulator with XRE-family HTH domain